MKESSSRGHIKEIHEMPVKTHVKMLKKYRVLNSNVRASGDEVIKTSHMTCQEILVVFV